MYKFFRVTEYVIPFLVITGLNIKSPSLSVPIHIFFSVSSPMVFTLYTFEDNFLTGELAGFIYIPLFYPIQTFPFESSNNEVVVTSPDFLKLLSDRTLICFSSPLVTFLNI